MNASIRQKIIATIGYADVFDYPLTRAELQRWLIGGGAATAVPGITPVQKGGKTYYILPGKNIIVDQRHKRQVTAKGKWQKIRSIIPAFTWIPTLLLVGVTGGLSMNNAEASDDIDLFFIARAGTLWFTRLLVTMTADWLSVRRRPNQESFADKICLNMYMAQDALTLPEDDQDLFAAHEVLQMVPMWYRGGIYSQFLSANDWVKTYLPNAWREKCQTLNDKWPIEKNFAFSIGHLALKLFEPTARALQLWYMAHHRTTEVIAMGVLRFHPKDARVWVKQKYARRLKKYNIPLDKIFHHR